MHFVFLRHLSRGSVEPQAEEPRGIQRAQRELLYVVRNALAAEVTALQHGDDPPQRESVMHLRGLADQPLKIRVAGVAELKQRFDLWRLDRRSCCCTDGLAVTTTYNVASTFSVRATDPAGNFATITTTWTCTGSWPAA